jgi:hypothetical protein
MKKNKTKRIKTLTSSSLLFLISTNLLANNMYIELNLGSKENIKNYENLIEYTEDNEIKHKLPTKISEIENAVILSAKEPLDLSSQIDTILNDSDTDFDNVLEFSPEYGVEGDIYYNIAATGGYSTPSSNHYKCYKSIDNLFENLRYSLFTSSYVKSVDSCDIKRNLDNNNDMYLNDGELRYTNNKCHKSDLTKNNDNSVKPNDEDFRVWKAEQLSHSWILSKTTELPTNAIYTKIKAWDIDDGYDIPLIIKKNSHYNELIKDNPTYYSKFQLVGSEFNKKKLIYEKTGIDFKIDKFTPILTIKVKPFNNYESLENMKPFINFNELIDFIYSAKFKKNGNLYDCKSKSLYGYGEVTNFVKNEINMELEIKNLLDISDIKRWEYSRSLPLINTNNDDNDNNDLTSFNNKIDEVIDRLKLFENINKEKINYLIDSLKIIKDLNEYYFNKTYNNLKPYLSNEYIMDDLGNTHFDTNTFNTIKTLNNDLNSTGTILNDIIDYSNNYKLDNTFLNVKQEFAKFDFTNKYFKPSDEYTLKRRNQNISNKSSYSTCGLNSSPETTKTIRREIEYFVPDSLLYSIVGMSNLSIINKKTNEIENINISEYKLKNESGDTNKAFDYLDNIDNQNKLVEERLLLEEKLLANEEYYQNLMNIMENNYENESKNLINLENSIRKNKLLFFNANNIDDTQIHKIYNINTLNSILYTSSKEYSNPSFANNNKKDYTINYQLNPNANLDPEVDGDDDNPTENDETIFLDDELRGSYYFNDKEIEYKLIEEIMKKNFKDYNSTMPDVVFERFINDNKNIINLLNNSQKNDLYNLFSDDNTKTINLYDTTDKTQLSSTIIGYINNDSTKVISLYGLFNNEEFVKKGAEIISMLNDKKDFDDGNVSETDFLNAYHITNINDFDKLINELLLLRENEIFNFGQNFINKIRNNFKLKKQIDNGIILQNVDGYISEDENNPLSLNDIKTQLEQMKLYNLSNSNYSAITDNQKLEEIVRQDNFVYELTKDYLKKLENYLSFLPSESTDSYTTEEYKEKLRAVENTVLNEI